MTMSDLSTTEEVERTRVRELPSAEWSYPLVFDWETGVPMTVTREGYARATA